MAAAMKIFQPLYDRVLTLSAHRLANRYLALMSVIEAIFFPIPPDVMLVPMCLSQPRLAWRFAAICTVASVAGAVVGYMLGDWLGEWLRPWLEQSRYAAAYFAVVQAFERYGVVYMVLAGFSPIPFKIFTISGGLLKMPLLPFVLAALVGRAARFFLVAGLIRLGGEPFAARLRQWVDWIGWGVVIIAGIGLVVWQWWR